jgi:type IV pilus assembly protein PilA
MSSDLMPGPEFPPPDQVLVCRCAIGTGFALFPLQAHCAADFNIQQSPEVFSMKSVQKGFTLIELMIVVAIIGILAAIAIPAYQNYVIRSQITEGLCMADAFKTAVADYYAQYGVFPTCQSTTGSAPTGGTGGCIATAGGNAGASNGKYVSAIDLTATAPGGQIQITFAGPQASAKLAGANVLTMQPGLSANEDVVWVCGTTTPPPLLTTAPASGAATTVVAAYLPSSCHN